ncbi:VWA domain-containing protein [Haloarculaceae archaeon H-GB2-1]|nr:VWA domain-containing protein [Haloarculaceae archaeon H-GB11]MEA5408518.1 VWA domain-containing protein [Haloarculaceae archaeon H-GB2-1]
MPDDAAFGNSGEAESETTALEDVEEDPQLAGLSMSLADEEDDEGGPDLDDVDQLEDIDPEQGEDADATETDDLLERVLADEVRDQASESRESTDEQFGEFDALQGAVEDIDAELETDGIVIPTDDVECDDDVYRKALEDSKRLARLLRNRFQKQRKRSLDRNLRRGRLDPSALHRSATGGKRLKMQRTLPEENDHHCLFVIDRSGSMNGETMATAERAMGMLVFALESVDVEVSVLELFDKQCRLAKPFAQPAQTVRNRLFNGKAQGGTPLADTLHIARERLKREQGKRFLFVVTDGTPSDPDRYMDALDRCTMPVVGVNLNDDAVTGMDCFHRQVTVDPETAELRKALRQLIQEVLFE